MTPESHLQFRGGHVDLIRVPVRASSLITPGDLVWSHAGSIRSAREFRAHNDAYWLVGFRKAFLGIAQEFSADGQTTPILVDVSPTSIYEREVAYDAYDVGEGLTADIFSHRMHCLCSVPTELAIARSRDFVDRPTSSLRVSFLSAFHRS